MRVAKDIQQEGGLQLQGCGFVGRDITFHAPSSLTSTPNADVMARDEAAILDHEAASMLEAGEQSSRERRSRTGA